MANVNLQAIISLKDHASAGLRKFSKNLDSAGSVADKILGPALLGVTAGVAGLTAIAIKSVNAFNEAEEGQKRLAHVLKTSRGASDKQVQSLYKQAEALARLGVVGDDTIIQAQAQLATFDLEVDTIKKLTPAILDYVVAEKGVAATTEDVKGLTNGLAQALNGNFASLTRVGFVLDDNTKKMISTGSETQKAGAIVKVLNSTYKDFNQNAATTTAGKLQKLRDGFGEIYEIIGESITGAIKPYIEKAVELTQKFLSNEEAVNKLKESIKRITETIVNAVVSFVNFIAQHQTLILRIGQLLLLIVGGAGLIKAVQGIMFVFGGVSKALGGGAGLIYWLAKLILKFTALTGPTGWIMLAAGAIAYLATHWSDLTDGIKNFTENVKFAYTELLKFIGLKERDKPLTDYTEAKAAELGYRFEKTKNADGSTSTKLVPKAHGGSVLSGKGYLVGENGPERFIPHTTGTIVPNSGMGGVTINFNGGVNMRSDQDIRAVGRILADQIALTQRGAW